MNQRTFSMMVLALLLCNRVFASRERLNFDSDWRFFARNQLALEDARDGIHLKWRWKSAGVERPKDETLAARGVDSSLSDWADAAPKEDVFGKQVGFAWFRAKLAEVPGPKRILYFEAVDDSAWVYVNGKLLLEHHGWNEPFDEIGRASCRERVCQYV